MLEFFKIIQKMWNTVCKFVRNLMVNIHCLDIYILSGRWYKIALKDYAIFHLNSLHRPLPFDDHLGRDLTNGQIRGRQFTYVLTRCTFIVEKWCFCCNSLVVFVHFYNNELNYHFRANKLTVCLQISRICCGMIWPKYIIQIQCLLYVALA